MSTSTKSKYLKDWIDIAAKRYNLDPKLVAEIYESQWKFIAASLNKPIPENLHITNLGKFFRVREYGPRRFSPDGKTNYYSKPPRHNRRVEGGDVGEGVQHSGGTETCDNMRELSPCANTTSNTNML